MVRLAVMNGWLGAAAALAAAPAWAQEAACPEGEPCGEEFRWGAWGLIALGLMFFAVWLLPAPVSREDEAGKAGLPLMRLLQARIRQETTGWRRWQWPLLGLFFLGLGIASLAGWR